MLGIGATTAIYSLVDQVLLHALPVRQPERLVLIDWQRRPGRERFRQLESHVVSDLPRPGRAEAVFRRRALPGADQGRSVDGRRFPSRDGGDRFRQLLRGTRSGSGAGAGAHDGRCAHVRCEPGRGAFVRLLEDGTGRRSRCSRPRGAGEPSSPDDHRRGGFHVPRHRRRRSSRAVDSCLDVGASHSRLQESFGPPDPLDAGAGPPGRRRDSRKGAGGAAAVVQSDAPGGHAPPGIPRDHSAAPAEIPRFVACAQRGAAGSFRTAATAVGAVVGAVRRDGSAVGAGLFECLGALPGARFGAGAGDQHQAGAGRFERKARAPTGGRQSADRSRRRSAWNRGGPACRANADCVASQRLDRLRHCTRASIRACCSLPAWRAWRQAF